MSNMSAGPARGKGSVFSLFWNPPSIVISFRLGWNSLPTLQTDVSANLIKKTWSFLLRLASLIFFIGLTLISIFAACFSHDIHWTNNKVKRCLARYSPRATTTNRPTNRAPKKPAWPGQNWPKMPILVVLGQKILFFYLRNQKFCYPHNGKLT